MANGVYNYGPGHINLSRQLPAFDQVPGGRHGAAILPLVPLSSQFSWYLELSGSDVLQSIGDQFAKNEFLLFFKLQTDNA